MLRVYYYTEPEETEITISEEKKKVAEYIIEQVKLLDKVKLISNGTCYIDPSSNGYMFITFENIYNDRNSNTLEFYVSQKNKVATYIRTYNCPDKGHYWDACEDNIEFCNEEECPEVYSEQFLELLKVTMLKGYSMWGNKWGYITKEGRRARGTLATEYGIRFKNKEFNYDHKKN